eukprot:Em0009g224a
MQTFGKCSEPLQQNVGYGNFVGQCSLYRDLEEQLRQTSKEGNDEVVSKLLESGVHVDGTDSLVCGVMYVYKAVGKYVRHYYSGRSTLYCTIFNNAMQIVNPEWRRSMIYLLIAHIAIPWNARDISECLVK